MYVITEWIRTIQSIHSIYSTSGFDSNVQGHESNCNSNNGGCPVTLCIRERSNDASQRYPENKGPENHELIPLKCSKHLSIGKQKSIENVAVDISTIESNIDKTG